MGILVNANHHQRSKKPVEDGVDTVVGPVSPLPLPLLLVGMGNPFMVTGQYTLGRRRGMVLPVHTPMIIKFPASLLMLHKLVNKGFITIPKMTELVQPRIMLLHLIMAAILAVDCSLNTSHICNPHRQLL